MNEPRYAWLETTKEVKLVAITSQPAFTIDEAKEFHRQLGAAIEQAEQTPFQRWWTKQPSCGCPEGFRTICDRKFHQTEAEKLFESIWEAK